MKLKVLSLAALSALFLFSCAESSEEGDSKEGTVAVDEEAAAEAVTYEVDLEGSEVSWEGNMLNVKNHTGSVALSAGSVLVKDGKIVGGEFEVDLSKITTSDANYNEEQTSEKLIGHLQSPDFFDVAQFPTASYKITGTGDGTVSGDFTVRGVTKNENIDIKGVSIDGDQLKATGELVFNRQGYGVAYSTGSKDYVISDDIIINISLVANKAGE